MKFLENLKSWKTSLVGLSLAVVTLLTSFNVINEEWGSTWNQNATQVIDDLFVAISALASVVLVFVAKDSKKDNTNDKELDS
tara:strand:- start:435 stop:680 length:246 start_codon:yes stop_codon:yes gene_type:complete